MDDTELDKALWEMANAITAFAVLQTIAFVYVTLQPDSAKVLGTRSSRIGIRVLAPIATLIYLGAIWGCFLLRCMPECTASHHRDVWLVTSIGRSVFVAAAGVIPIWSTLVPAESRD